MATSLQESEKLDQIKKTYANFFPFGEKIVKTSKQLRPVTGSLSADVAKTLVQAFISSRLDYCNALLHGISDGRAHASSTIGPECRRATHKNAAPRSHLANPATTSLAARPSSSDVQDRRPGLSVFSRPGTGISGWRLPADLRRSHVPTSIDGHSDVRRSTFQQHFRWPVFCVR